MQVQQQESVWMTQISHSIVSTLPVDKCIRTKDTQLEQQEYSLIRSTMDELRILSTALSSILGHGRAKSNSTHTSGTSCHLLPENFATKSTVDGKEKHPRCYLGLSHNYFLADKKTG